MPTVARILLALIGTTLQSRKAVLRAAWHWQGHWSSMLRRARGLYKKKNVISWKGSCTQMVPIIEATQNVQASADEVVQLDGKSYVRMKPSDFVGRDPFNAHFRAVFNPTGPGVIPCSCGMAKGCGYAWATCGLLMLLVGIPCALCLLHTATREAQHHTLLGNGFNEVEGTNGRQLVSIQGPWLVRATHTSEEACIKEAFTGPTKVSFTVERFLEEGYKEALSWPEYWKLHLADAGDIEPTERVKMMEDFDRLWNPNNPHRLEEQTTVVFSYGPIHVGVKGRVKE